ncbi:tyrosine-type recombinase/integrase [Lacrimispora sp.]|uniref:tyrosine-type recombinase/integrase n=1 Tax=Lacrimispora sp. TaxID=2719234 RepID=UPI0028B0931F|nr:site-specific integrase [Lacrimispora sp.]
MAVDKNGKTLPPGTRQRSNGKYEGRVQYESERYSVYADTLTELKRKMNDLRYKLEHGEFITNTKLTLGEWYKTWIEQYKENQVKVGTIISYNDYFNCCIKEGLGKKKLVDIRGEHIQKFYNDLKKRGFTLSSMRIVAAILNGCLKQAMKNGLIERNPVPLATLPKGKAKEEHRVFTKAEQDIFMEYAQDSYLYNMFALAIRTGLRGGEIRGLKLSDVDKSMSVLHVQRTLKYIVGKGFLDDTPKTTTSKRDIPLTKDMIAIIDREKQVYGEKVLRMDGYIFHLPDGTPISRERVQIEIDRIVKKINKADIPFERFTPHCFRHTFATRAIENGMKPQTLQTILGPSTLSMTMDLYSHVLPTTKAEEMEMIAGAF